MATIEKRTADRKTTYRVKIRLRGYPSESATFERMSDAKAWAQKIESDMRAGRYFGEAKRHTFGELADKYLADRETLRLRSFADRKRQITFWRGVFGDHLLHDVTPARITVYKKGGWEEKNGRRPRCESGNTAYIRLRYHPHGRRLRRRTVDDSPAPGPGIPAHYSTN